MTAYVVLGIGMLALSAVISYACWVKARIWILRQDLFEIRDRLWDEGDKGGFLGDPEYRQARELINGIIRFAPLYTLQVVLYMSKRGTTAQCYRIPAIRNAVAQVGRRVTIFVLFQTLSGLAYVTWHVIKAICSSGIEARRSETIRRVEKDTGRVVLSDEMLRVDRIIDRRGTRVPA